MNQRAILLQALSVKISSLFFSGPEKNFSQMNRDGVPPMDIWGLDPLWDAHIRTSIALLLTREPATADDQCCAFLLPNDAGAARVISKVRLLGDVVALEEKPLMWSFILDDGSGLLRCVLWKDDSNVVSFFLSIDESCCVSASLTLR